MKNFLKYLMAAIDILCLCAISAYCLNRIPCLILIPYDRAAEIMNFYLIVSGIILIIFSGIIDNYLQEETEFTEKR